MYYGLCADSHVLTAMCWHPCADHNVLTSVCWQPFADSRVLTSMCWPSCANICGLTFVCWSPCANICVLSADSRLLTAVCWQPSAESRVLTAVCWQQCAHNRELTLWTNNPGPTAVYRQPCTDSCVQTAIFLQPCTVCSTCVVSCVVYTIVFIVMWGRTLPYSPMLCPHIPGGKAVVSWPVYPQVRGTAGWHQAAQGAAHNLSPLPHVFPPPGGNIEQLYFSPRLGRKLSGKPCSFFPHEDNKLERPTQFSWRYTLPEPSQHTS